MDHYIEPNIRRLSEDEGSHWLWTQPFRDLHPTLNFFSAHDLLAVRLTWLCTRPDEVLQPRKNPVKIDQLCDDSDMYRACINPYHYCVITQRRDPASNWKGTRQGLPDGRIPKSHRHYADEQGVVRCWDCKEPMSPALQAKYQQGRTLNRFEHCPRCWNQRMNESGGLGRQLRGANRFRQETTYTRDLEQQVNWEIFNRGGEGGPQVLPPEDEEPYVPTPLPYPLPDQNEV